VRQRVELLLGAHASPGSFLQLPAAAPLLATVDDPVGERPGADIGPYKLLEQIGEGGFGMVFMAEQQEPIRRRVALKVLKPGMDSKQVLARFEAERQALALMDHPNIARVLDAGQTSTGRPYFVMELVKGLPITDFCDQGQFTPRERLALFVHVCAAVQHAHQKGIIHRDIKPSNVLVTLHDGAPQVKVIDFGIAKALGERLTDKTLFTGFQQMVGTPLYMSPEQAGLSGLDADTRSDVYSLGVLLYELLTGTTPFTPERLRQVGYDELRRIIREEEPQRPSTRVSTLGQAAATVWARRKSDLRRLSQLFRGELDWIVLKALEKERGRRYESASAFAQDIQRYLNDQPVQACPPSAGYRLRKFVRRNRAGLAIAAVACLAVLAAAGSLGWAVRDREARDAEIAQKEIARLAELERKEIARLATVEERSRGSLNTARALIRDNQPGAARRMLAEARAQLGNDRPALASLAAEIEAGEATRERFDQFLGLIDRAREAELAGLVSPGLEADGPPRATNAERQPTNAVPILLRALACFHVLDQAEWSAQEEGGWLAAAQVGQVRRSVYEELLWLADDVLRRRYEHSSGRKLSGKAAARQALAYLTRAQAAYRPTQALHRLRARCFRALEDKATAQAVAQRAASTRPTLALDHYLQGQAAFDARQQAEAIQAFEAALDLEPTHYWSMMRLGYCLCDLGQGREDFAGAVRVFTGCILKRPDHAHAYFCRGNAYRNLGRYEAAVLDYSRALELSPNKATAWNNRAAAYKDLGKPEKALADYTRAVDLDPKHAIAWHGRGLVHSRLGQPEKALADFSRAIELNPKDAVARYNRGDLLLERGEPEKALADFNTAIELRPRYALAWGNRGSAYLRLGQPFKALPNCTRAIELDEKNVIFWLNRGTAHLRLRQRDQAIADYSRAIELSPKLAAGWLNRGQAHLPGQPEQAVADFTRAIELSPKDAQIWFHRAGAYVRLRQPAKALADLNKTIKLDPKNALAWNSRGATHGDLDQEKQAVDDFTEAIRLNPKLAPAWSNRGNGYLKLGQPGKAVADCSQAIKLSPKYVKPWLIRGLAHFELGQPDRAVVDCSQVIALAGNHPQWAPAYLVRGRAHHQLAHYPQALADYQRFLERAPRHAQGNNAMAWLLATCPDAELRDPGQAVALAKKAVALAPKNGECRNTLGVAHYRAGDAKAAVVALLEARKLPLGGGAVASLFLALAYQTLGERAEARRAYDQAVAWIENNRQALEKDRPQAEELRRFCREAETALGLKK
jgi:tetratricopeptide (TPR) repeat protein/serine/threonine protein kinase